MSFGFSISDLLAAGKLIIDITDSLRSVGVAKSEYQEIYGQLEALQDGLRRLDQLAQCDVSSSTLANITKVGQSCQHTLRGFFNKVQKYESSLGIWSKPSKFLGTGAKLRWTFKMKGELQSFQSHLATHIATINMLLGQYGLQQLQSIKTTSDTHHLHVRQQLQNTTTSLEIVQNSMPAQALTLQMVQGSVSTIEGSVSGHLKDACKKIQDTVAGTDLTSRRIHEILLELRSRPPAVETRFTYFQAPFVVNINLHNIEIPVPAEYSYEMLLNVLEFKFKSDQGGRSLRTLSPPRNDYGWISESISCIYFGIYALDVHESPCGPEEYYKLPPGTKITVSMMLGRGAPLVRILATPRGIHLTAYCETCASASD